MGFAAGTAGGGSFTDRAGARAGLVALCAVATESAGGCGPPACDEPQPAATVRASSIPATLPAAARHRWWSVGIRALCAAGRGKPAAAARTPEPDLESLPVTATTPNADGRVERFGLLLGAVIAAFLLQGIGPTADWSQIVTSALLGTTLLLALRTAEVRPRVMRPAIVTVVILILVSVVEAAEGKVGGGATHVANALLVGLAPAAIVIGIVRSLRAKQTVTVEAVLGVLSVYILLGMFFAFIYGAVDRLGGAPFFSGGQEPNVAHLLYFSFTTLTTVGYGDLTARTNLGHTLAVSEALFGQIYLVTVVSLIVGNLGRSRPVVQGGGPPT